MLEGIAPAQYLRWEWSYTVDQLAGHPMTGAIDRHIKMAAATRFPVLILGERGSGKRTVAKLIHSLSESGDSPFTEVPAGDLPLGFAANSVASLALHSPGTVYLTECSKLPAVAQQELISFLQESPAAGTGRARVIGSAGRDFGHAVDAGGFREDLYYALGTICMAIPPLRYRPADILAIADCLLERYAALFQRSKPTLGPDSREFLLLQRWPGNVSQLEELTKILVAIEDERVAIAAARSALAEFAVSPGTSSIVSLKEVGRGAARAAERGAIEQALLRTDWNRKRAAEQLNVSYKALLYKVREFGLAPVPTSAAR